MAAFASFWHGSILSPYEELSIKSFLHHGHRVRVFSYDTTLRVPMGCELCDARTIFPEDSLFFYSGRQVLKVAAFSNMFRYKLLFDHDMIWTDMDVVCLGRDGFDRDFVFARQDEEYYNGAVLKFPRGHEAMRLAAEYCWERRDKAVWGDLGPRLLTRVIEEYELHSEAMPREYLYPLHWRDVLMLHDPAMAEQVFDLIENSLTIHLWNDMFSRIGMRKTDTPKENSAISALFAKHGVAWRETEA